MRDGDGLPVRLEYQRLLEDADDDGRQALDDTGEVSMRIFFNITMVRRGRAAWALRACGPHGRGRGLRVHVGVVCPGTSHRGMAWWCRAQERLPNPHPKPQPNPNQERLPCQFAVVDVEDIMGTSVTNPNPNPNPTPR